MNHGSFFTGIGGFDLAAEWCGWNNCWQIEKDPYCLKVLQKNFPNVKKYGDIKDVKGKELQAVNIASGGFPCQPFSVAGLQTGKDDDRYLWPEMLRLIKEIEPKPTWILGENVAGIINMELESVVASLEAEGYEVQPIIIPAASIGAPHRRERVWILAHTISNGWRKIGSEQFTGSNQVMANSKYDGSSSAKSGSRTEGSTQGQKEFQQSERSSALADTISNTEGSAYRRAIGIRESGWNEQNISERNEVRSNASNCSADVSNSNGSGLGKRWRTEPVQSQFDSAECASENASNNDNSRCTRNDRWKQEEFFTQRSESRRDEWWVAEPNVGRVAHGISNRVDRLKGLGNAIVPRVAFEIFKAIETIEKRRNQ